MSTQHQSAPSGGKRYISKIKIAALAVIVSLMTISVASQPAKAEAHHHSVAKVATKKQSSKTQATFWQDLGYQGSYKRQSTLGKKQMLNNTLLVVFTKDHQFRQRVTTSLSMNGIQEQVTDGQVTQKGNVLTLVPKSTATAVYKTEADYKKHAASNYHRSGEAFKSQLIFAKDGQPLQYRVDAKHKRLTGLKNKVTVSMKQSSANTLATAQDYIKPIENH
ncbi:MAG: hypothetical protein LKG79_00380 [Furfurilactobacillus sp.]|jgi:hypothetical protein|uniref:Cell surface protein n=1 Tax=Furfurilactobacillus milii TaxID=2888272 RepID=A0ABT6D6C6_9LACO|nr:MULTISPECIES: hypothetical protein [Furfurilactobacillus]QLE66273.1 hypothetical protein LROSL2_0923 [Furfurilactobacillus rossiae]MCF6159731.1 hypothetical protein [Furfurilactobacillus milii]MCF6163184.1 hypothetical protein [Furfurilactobacillus milii]MCF6419111.1 hypothetical protein [Furfurilactobacillus milii]MCH4011014.1 hypothetical protein [Furfurilactobacillus sp.]